MQSKSFLRGGVRVLCGGWGCFEADEINQHMCHTNSFNMLCLQAADGPTHGLHHTKTRVGGDPVKAMLAAFAPSKDGDKKAGKQTHVKYKTRR